MDEAEEMKREKRLPGWRGRDKKGGSIGRRGSEEEGRTMINREERRINMEIGWERMKRKRGRGKNDDQERRSEDKQGDKIELDKKEEG